jgi:Fe-S oxidoreductase
MQAEENVETLKQYQFERIITQCPHCYNTLKNEYPQFGGEWQVLHHSQYIQELIGAGRLMLDGQQARGQVTFHDSCYLGRYNQVYDAPRQVLNSIQDLDLAEMKRSREQGFCCGGGGGAMWLEHEAGRRVNEIRTNELLELGPDTAAVACPFCLIMLEEAVIGRSTRVPLALQDIAELVAEAI